MTTDPTLDEMRRALEDALGDEADECEVDGSVYWFAADNHGGQGSNLYAALCRCGYRPGPIERGPEEGSLMELCYRILEDEFGSLGEHKGGG